MFKSTRAAFVTALIGTPIFLLGLDLNAAAMGNPSFLNVTVPQRLWMEVVATAIALIGLVPTVWGGLSYVDIRWPDYGRDP